MAVAEQSLRVTLKDRSVFEAVSFVATMVNSCSPAEVRSVVEILILPSWILMKSGRGALGSVLLVITIAGDPVEQPSGVAVYVYVGRLMLMMFSVLSFSIMYTWSLMSVLEST